MGKRKQDTANTENGSMVSKSQKPDQNGKLQDWQKEPPFVRERDGEAKEEPLYVGRCHCQTVKFNLYAEPKQVSIATAALLMVLAVSQASALRTSKA